MNKRRRPNLVSPFANARNALFEYLARPFNWFEPRTRFILLFFIFVAITTLLLTNPLSRPADPGYKEGDVVRRTIYSPADISGVDTTEWERRQQQAMAATPPIFVYESQRVGKMVESFTAAWDGLRQQSQTRGADPKSLQWPGAGGSEVARIIRARGFDPKDLETLTRVLRESAGGMVYQDGEAKYLAGDIKLVDRQTLGTQSVITNARSQMVPLSAANEMLAKLVGQLPGWTSEEKDVMTVALLPFVKPNVLFDEDATRAVREAAALKAVPPAISLKRDQAVVREGDTVTRQSLAELAAIRPYVSTERPWRQLAGLLVIVTAVFWVAWKFIENRSTSVSLSLSKRRAFALVGSAVIVQTVLVRVGFAIAALTALPRVRPPLNDSMIWSFAIPFAAASLLVALLVDTQLALLTGLLTALFAGLIAPNGIAMTFYATVSSAAAIYVIRRYRERQSVTVAGGAVAAVNAVMAIALMAFAQQALPLNGLLLAMGCGILGGLLTSVFTAGGLPINESTFGILTDVKLLELSNADLPVLGQLALRAPGTNQHSHAVGQLAEESCRAIGGNPLLVRIGALYHDIGKTAAPEYFVENQQGENPHDQLRPANSAKIIISHVKYGMKLAKEIGLPKRIADFIPQHHGTRTLHFFLRKAQAEARDGEIIDETDFRYSGPKPQFKESAIMLLADSCEAAARSLTRPDPENIHAIVNRIFDAVVSDGQLDECDLTLRELTTVKESMISSLTAIYHARIDYPGFNAPLHSGTLPPLPSEILDTEERGVSYKRVSEIPISKGGEVEDEAMPFRAVKR